MEDFSFFSASSADTHLICFGLSMSQSSGLKEVSSFSSSDHAGESMSPAIGSLSLPSIAARGTLFTTMLIVGISREMLNPYIPMSLRSLVIDLLFAIAGSASRSPTVVRTRSSFLLYSAYANLMSDALLIVSLMVAGGQLLALTRLPFSTDLTRNLRCQA